MSCVRSRRTSKRSATGNEAAVPLRVEGNLRRLTRHGAEQRRHDYEHEGGARTPAPRTSGARVVQGVLATQTSAYEKRMTAPVDDSDPHWRLGLAQVRAEHILRLIRLYEDGEAGISRVLDGIADEAQAILDQSPTLAKDDAT
jgi:hypothetical protein